MGQVCSAAKRFFVQEEIIDEFIRLLRERLNNYPVVALNSDVAYKRLIDQITRGVDSGAELLMGDLDKLKNNETDIFVIRLSDKNSPLLKEEVFGPVFVIKSYKDDAEVLEMVNSSRYGLGCSIYDMWLERAEYMASRVESGMVFINSFTTSKSELPWGGCKESGYGRDSWRTGIETFARLKTVRYGSN